MKRILQLSLILTSFILKAQTPQWQMGNNGNCNYIPKCFIESSGLLLSTGSCFSVDSGSNWFFPSGGIYALSLKKSTVGLFAGSDSAIYFSANNGTTWNAVYTTGHENFVWDLAILNDTIYAATRSSGILMSPNSGITWTPVNIGLTTDSILSILVKDNLLFAGTYNNGMFMSSNSGGNWTPINTGLPGITSIPTIATDGTNLFISTGSNIYTSNNDGSTWIHRPISAPTINKIINVGNAMLAGGFTNSGAEGIYRSLDSGISWTTFNYGMPNGCAYGVGALYATSAYVYCGIEAACNGGIYRIDRNAITTSINYNQVPENIFNIYPNPANEILHINTSQSIVDAEYKIYDLTGRIIQNGNILGESISIKNLSAQIYVLQIIDGKNSEFKNFVKL